MERINDAIVTNMYTAGNINNSKHMTQSNQTKVAEKSWHNSPDLRREKKQYFRPSERPAHRRPALVVAVVATTE